MRTIPPSRNNFLFSSTSFLVPLKTLNLNGTAGNHSSVQVQFRSNDLHEVESVATLFGATAQPLDLYGTATFSGMVEGSTADPQIRGQLAATSLKIRGTEWLTLRTDLDANSSHMNLRDGDITPAKNGGRIMFTVSLGLDHWVFKDTNPIQIDLDAAEINMVDLRNLTGLQAPVSGTLAAKISFHGSLLNPIGHGTINLTQAMLADEPIQSLNVNFDGTDNEIHAQVALRMAAGAVQGKATYFPREKRYDAELDAAGIQLNQFQTLTDRNLQVSGALNLTAKGSGTLSDPSFQLMMDVPQLQIRNETISGIKLQANVANHAADVTLDSEALSASVHGHGKVNLSAPTMRKSAWIRCRSLFGLYSQITCLEKPTVSPGKRNCMRR